MNIEPARNPRVAVQFSKSSISLFQRQVNKYFEEVSKTGKGFDTGNSDYCLVCDGCRDSRDRIDCERCPLGDGKSHGNIPCVEHPTFISESIRRIATPLRLVRRMDYLIAQFKINGVDINIDDANEFVYNIDDVDDVDDVDDE